MLLNCLIHYKRNLKHKLGGKDLNMNVIKQKLKQNLKLKCMKEFHF